MSETCVDFHDYDDTEGKHTVLVCLRCNHVTILRPLGNYLTEWPRGDSYENRIPLVSYKATFVMSDDRIQIDSAILDRETFE
jgi:hypothetical protein